MMGGNRFCFFIIAALIVVPSIWLWFRQETPQEEYNRAGPNSTRGWCSGTDNTDRFCRFENLCFSSAYDNFIFFHGEESILEGIPPNRFEPALVDLSSVADHNTQYFHYIDEGIERKDEIPHKEYHYKRGKYLLFNRFNPDNMMHVFHDDLLPIFFTLLRQGLLKDDKSLVTLVPFEGRLEGEFRDLYQILSKERYFLRTEFPQESLLCFQEMYIGLSKMSVWYHYGFRSPQGPVPDIELTSFQVEHFRYYFRRKFDLPHTCPSQAYGVLLTREWNRLILNEEDLAVTISNVFNLKMLSMGSESHSIVDMINVVSCAKLLIGVHGSLLILSMFLPHSSILVEIFPYAINPDHYTPYKTLVSLPGMGIEYVSWRNMDPEGTVTHPGNGPEYGGINHLDKTDQELILGSSEVPRHLCCQDPQWLFRIYQDTIVNVSAIGNLLTKAMLNLSQHSSPSSWDIDSTKHHLAPGFVSNITCSQAKNKSMLNVFWSQPLNINLIGKYSEIQFEVLVQGQGSTVLDRFIVNNTAIEVHETSGYDSFFVWIRTIAMGTKGPQSSIECKLLS